MSIIDLNKLRSELKNVKDAKQRLASEYKLSITTINHILYGYRRNDAVIISAAKMIAEHKEAMEATSNFINNL